ncbi:gamma-mobile-trio protein GmtX [Oceanospirillum sanctuarii]|uniref:gamma-mobile-trio protein GmtX n=1 Tax=Oceanospirillum sanctuarii TaxID=1434821 RepID=UPI001C3C9FD3|nr:gamma-mobile-trio protein GmtX [Oceanospirillum sanctuarii]
MTMSDPNAVYEAVQSQLKSARSRKSLESLHTVCKELFESGSVDFKITTIARLGASRGVPGAQTIRNKTGEPYRALIEAWRELSHKKNRKSAAKSVRGKHDWVDELQNPAHRFLVLDLIAQVRHLRAENQRYASITQLKIDCRAGSEAVVEPQLPHFLEYEIDALKEAVSDEFLARQGWVRGPHGKVIGVNGMTIFSNGYLNAIEKVLSLNHG